ncbi:MAG: cytochrome C oxidase subunit I, partial [Anaerolineae bacterium]|nr:cytochrome C oxidase subunit I [Anaerolineae bacterium]
MKNFLSIGMVRGILAQVVGMAAGYGLVTAIQAISGARLKAEPAWVVGGFISAFCFLIALGAFNDWFRMAKGEEVEEPENVVEPSGGKRYWGLSFDHKVIGVQYGFLSL